MTPATRGQPSDVSTIPTNPVSAQGAIPSTSFMNHYMGQMLLYTYGIQPAWKILERRADQPA